MSGKSILQRLFGVLGKSHGDRGWLSTVYSKGVTKVWGGGSHKVHRVPSLRDFSLRHYAALNNAFHAFQHKRASEGFTVESRWATGRRTGEIAVVPPFLMLQSIRAFGAVSQGDAGEADGEGDASTTGPPLVQVVNGHRVLISVCGISKGQAQYFPFNRTHAWLSNASPELVFQHVDKSRTCGEDAFVIAREGDSIVVGVADGVGGWAELGIDAGVVSHRLMELVYDEATAKPIKSPSDLLSQAHEKLRAESTKHPERVLTGSTTACLSVIQPDGEGLRLHGVNVGDSGLIVVRNGAVMYSAPPTVHGDPKNRFVAPRQLASLAPQHRHHGGGSDRASHGSLANVPLSRGDYIVYGSDGLLDNVPDAKIAAIVKERAASGSPDGGVPAISRGLFDAAQNGRKMDDIVIVVVHVE